jgi:hypothetical protein
VNSFLRLLRVGSRPHKSERQREKERARRRKEGKWARKSRSSNSGRRRAGNSLTKEALNAIGRFFAVTLAFIPVFLRMLSGGKKRSGGGSRARKATGVSASTGTKKATKQKKPSANEHPANPSGTQSKQPKEEKKPKEPQQEKKVSAPPAPVSEPKVREAEAQTTPLEETSPVVEKATPQTVEQPTKETVLDEKTPKSTPKNAADQYIRKRMMIAGSSYCDQAVLDRIEIGTQLEIVAEPDNPYDSDAIMLLLDGEKVGYIAKKDQMAYVTCLKLKRSVYAVVTDISDDFPPRYEYETWFASK